MEWHSEVDKVKLTFEAMLEEAKRVAEEAEALKQKLILKANGAFHPGAGSSSLKIEDEKQP